MVKNPPANAGDMGSIPGPGRSHTKEKKKRRRKTKETSLKLNSLGSPLY